MRYTDQELLKMPWTKILNLTKQPLDRLPLHTLWISSTTNKGVSLQCQIKICHN